MRAREDVITVYEKDSLGRTLMCCAAQHITNTNLNDLDNWKIRGRNIDPRHLIRIHAAGSY
jgi:hypothetical protein